MIGWECCCCTKCFSCGGDEFIEGLQIKLTISGLVGIPPYYPEGENCPDCENINGEYILDFEYFSFEMWGGSCRYRKDALVTWCGSPTPTGVTLIVYFSCDILVVWVGPLGFVSYPSYEDFEFVPNLDGPKGCSFRPFDAPLLPFESPYNFGSACDWSDATFHIERVEP